MPKKSTILCAASGHPKTATDMGMYLMKAIVSENFCAIE
jgi:hypothetical protein